MGKSIYENSAFAKKLFEQANEIVGFRISDSMFNGTEEELRQTKVTQPAIFLHSVIAFKGIENNKPDMVAGHSLGEFSALVASGVLSFEDGLQLVAARAGAAVLWETRARTAEARSASIVCRAASYNGHCPM